VQKVITRKEVMSPASTIQQPETTNPGADEYPQRFNLLDVIGVSHDLSPVNPRPDKSGPPEEDHYGNPISRYSSFACLNNSASFFSASFSQP
jgi:hypothetical protein